jgi:hypothetical protein
MAELPVQDIAEDGVVKRRFDPLVWGAAIFFVLAAGLAAVPAMRAGPTTLAGLLLLGGVAGVAILGLVAIRASAHHESDLDAAEGFIDALSEPTALVAADGRLLAANAPWREIMGDARRLPKGVAGSGLFAALVAPARARWPRGSCAPTAPIASPPSRAWPAAACWSAWRRPRRPKPSPPKSRPRRWSRPKRRRRVRWTPSPAPRRSARPCWRGWTPSTRASWKPIRPCWPWPVPPPRPVCCSAS